MPAHSTWLGPIFTQEEEEVLVAAREAAATPLPHGYQGVKSRIKEHEETLLTMQTYHDDAPSTTLDDPVLC